MFVLLLIFFFFTSLKLWLQTRDLWHTNSPYEAAWHFPKISIWCVLASENSRFHLKVPVGGGGGSDPWWHVRGLYLFSCRAAFSSGALRECQSFTPSDLSSSSILSIFSYLGRIKRWIAMTPLTWRRYSNVTDTQTCSTLFCDCNFEMLPRVFTFLDSTPACRRFLWGSQRRWSTVMLQAAASWRMVILIMTIFGMTTHRGLYSQQVRLTRQAGLPRLFWQIQSHAKKTKTKSDTTWPALSGKLWLIPALFFPFALLCWHEWIRLTFPLNSQLIGRFLRCAASFALREIAGCLERWCHLEQEFWLAGAFIVDQCSGLPLEGGFSSFQSKTAT